MTNEELKAVVVTAVEKRQEEGFRFLRSTYFSDRGKVNCGCLVGAVLNRHRNPEFKFAESELAKELGATEDQIFSMEAGFCSWGKETIVICGLYHERDPEMYEFGREMADKVHLNYEYAN